MNAVRVQRHPDLKAIQTADQHKSLICIADDTSLSKYKERLAAQHRGERRSQHTSRVYESLGLPLRLSSHAQLRVTEYGRDGIVTAEHSLPDVRVADQRVPLIV